MLNKEFLQVITCAILSFLGVITLIYMSLNQLSQQTSTINPEENVVDVQIEKILNKYE